MGKDNRPPKHLRILKRGDVREDGTIFWAYAAQLTNGEFWVSKEKYLDMKSRADHRNHKYVCERRQDPELMAKHKEFCKRWYAQNRDYARKKDKERYDRAKNDREALMHRRNRKKEYQRHRRKQDPQFKIANNLRRRMGEALRKGYGKKSGGTLELVGCSWAELKSHLESQFTDGMSWENYGRTGWHVDHIKPCAFFDLTIDEQQKECFHYTNLQPLWAEDNIKKSDHYE